MLKKNNKSKKAIEIYTQTQIYINYFGDKKCILKCALPSHIMPLNTFSKRKNDFRPLNIQLNGLKM